MSRVAPPMPASYRDGPRMGACLLTATVTAAALRTGSFDCGTRTRKVCRPQFQRTQRASGLRPSRRSLPRGLHGPDRELDRYATRSASAGGCRKSGWLTAASRRLPDRRVQNVWSVTVYVRSVLITSTVDPSKRYTRSYLAGGAGTELCAGAHRKSRAARRARWEPSEELQV